MAAAAIVGEELRARRRRRVDWDAECRLGGFVIWGLFRDYSWRGAFFEPEIAYPPAREACPAALQFLEVADQIVVTFTRAPFHEAIRALATVCWIGHSSAHGVNGLGMRFEEV